MKKQYVYTITYNGEVMYVGKTSNMAVRKSAHKTKRGTYYSAIPVEADLSKIEFNVVAEFDNEDEALKYEDQLMLRYNTLDGGWNKQRSGLIETSDIKAYQREYYQAHREEAVAYQREYDAAHREEKAAYDRDYYEAHREEKVAYQREYDAAHREEKAVYNRDYNAAHKEEKAVYNRDYYKANKEHILAQQREYRAHKKPSVIPKALS